MKEFLTKKYFGGRVPGYVIILVIGGLAFVLMRRRKNAGKPQENPAASASEDETQPFPYSAPDMFPLQGATGPAGPPGPAGPRGKPGKSAPGVHAKNKKKKGPAPAKKVYRRPAKPREIHVGNIPAYNKRLKKPIPLSART